MSDWKELSNDIKILKQFKMIQYLKNNIERTKIPKKLYEHVVNICREEL